MCANPHRCGTSPIWSPSPKVFQRGVSLIELIVFIIIVSVGVVGLISVTGSLNRSSADPMLRKQMVAIAESLLNEVLHQPFTYCDPNDAQVSTATGAIVGAAGCAVRVEALGPDTAFGTQLNAETRYQNLNGGNSPFDNVNDYNGFVMPDANCAGICDAQDSTVPIAALAGYAATVAIAPAGAAFSVAADAALQVTVTVTRAGQDNFVLTGYRFRYAPRN